MTAEIRRRLAGTRQGYALITGLVFLTVLTTIGIFTLKNTALEIMMSANNNKGVQAFEASETTRVLTSQLIDAHLSNRDWPKSLGGSIEDGRFGHEIPAGLILSKVGSEQSPRNWYDGSLQTSPGFNSLDLSEVDARYSQNISSKDFIEFKLQGSAVVKTLRRDIQAGSNSAMSSGYEGQGNGAAAGGGNIFLYVAAQGQDPTGQATRFTAAVYRYVIRN